MEYVYLEGMSGQDVCRIRDYDRPTLRQRATRFYEEKRRAILKRGKYPYVDVMYYKIPHTQREYMIAIMFLTKRDAQYDPKLLYFPIVRESKGICMYETTHGVTLVEKYLPHVFDRYIERMADIIPSITAMTRLEVIRTFLKRNLVRPLQGCMKERNGKEELEFYINDGCLMIHHQDIEKDDNVRKVMTFIDNSLLKGEQHYRRTEHDVLDDYSIRRCEYIVDSGLAF